MDGLQPQISFSGQSVFNNQINPSGQARQANDALEAHENYSPQHKPPSRFSDSETGSSGDDDADNDNDAQNGEHETIVNVTKDKQKEDSPGRMSVDDNYQDASPSMALTGRRLLSTGSSSFNPNPNPVFTATLSSSDSTPTSMLTATLDFTGPSLPLSSPMSYGGTNKTTIEFDDKIRKYLPEQFETIKAYDVGGINILNKKTVDSQTALDKIKRRRETHNRVERRRRDQINQVNKYKDLHASKKRGEPVR